MQPALMPRCSSHCLRSWACAAARTNKRLSPACACNPTSNPQRREMRNMHTRMLLFALFFVMSTAAFTQTSTPNGDESHANDGRSRNNPPSSTGTGTPRQMNHSGLITPHTTNDRGVIPANPSTDNDIRNPGRSQGLITHAGPPSQ
jgi:hypothetical protein